MNVLHLRLTPDTLVRRSFELRDVVEIETPTEHLIIHVDPSSAHIAAEAGAPPCWRALAGSHQARGPRHRCR